MPANAQGVRAGRAYVEASLKDNALRDGLKAAEARLKAFAGRVKDIGDRLRSVGAGVSGLGAKAGVLGGAIGVPLLGAAKAFADIGSELNDMSGRTGVSVEALSELGHAATQTGTDLSAVEAGARKMARNVVDAGLGSKEAAESLSALGLSAGDLLRMKPEDQFKLIASRIAGIEDPTLKSAIALRLFGKSGTQLLPMIDNLDALTAEARALGLVMSKEDAEAADALGDALDIASKVAKRAAITIGAALAPALTDLLGALTQTIVLGTRWLAQNQETVKAVAKVAVGVGAAGAALVVLGPAITAVGAGLAFLASPLGVLTVGLAAGTAALVHFGKTGGDTMEALGKRFEGMRDDAELAFAGIAAAMKSGDIPAAAALLTAAMKVETLRIKILFQEAWAFIGSEAKSAFIDLKAIVQANLTNAIGLVGDEWVKLVGMILQSTNTLSGEFRKLRAELLAALNPFEDADAALKRIDAETASRNATQRWETGAALLTRQQGRAGELAGIEAQRQAGQAANLANQDMTGLFESDAQLANARDDLAALLLEGAGVGGGGGGGLPLVGRRPGQPGIGEDDIDPEKLDKAIDQMDRKVDVVGTFSGLRLQGLSAGESIADRQLKAQEETRDAVQKLNDRARQGRLVFGA